MKPLLLPRTLPLQEKDYSSNRNSLAPTASTNFVMTFGSPSCPRKRWTARVKIKDARSIPEQMGSFKIFFHQVQPKVAGGHVYMRVWLGHNKDPELLHEAFLW